jgi:hypothetical protein
LYRLSLAFANRIVISACASTESEDVGTLFHGGDIDNRLKTFFDALQVPQASEQIPASSRNPQAIQKNGRRYSAWSIMIAQLPN